MKLKRKSGDRNRLFLPLELAVVLPAAALVILSIWHLNQIRRDRAVEAAIQREFNEVLKISEKQFNQKIYAIADDARAGFPKSASMCGNALDRVLATNPNVAHVYMYDPDHGFILRSQPERLKDPLFKGEADDLAKMDDQWMKMEYHELAEKMTKMEKKDMPYYFFQNWAPRGDKKMYQTVAMFVIHGSGGSPDAIGGIALDADYLHDRLLPDLLENAIGRNLGESQSETNPAVMMLHARNDSSQLAASQGWDGGEPEVERNLEGALPGLVLAIKLHGTTLDALEQRFMRTSFLIVGALAILLAGGMFLVHRNVAKEMALARLKSDFVSNVSHELRTPLSLIRLYAETLEMGRLTSPEKYQEYYSIIRKESERLTSLINNILDFSRIEAGRKEYDFRETDLTELVHNTLDSYRYQIEQNGFTYQEKISPDVPRLRVDREAMARSLLNLVNNALKYSQDQKHIGINLYRDNGSVKLEVLDHGIGIPAQEQQRIFEKFYRVGDPLVHNTKGSGLGLSLVRHIVQAHGGEVAVDSTPGQGSKFTIILPVNGATLPVAVRSS